MDSLSKQLLAIVNFESHTKKAENSVQRSNENKNVHRKVDLSKVTTYRPIDSLRNDLKATEEEAAKI